MAYKVKELIVRLKQYNPEARVVLQSYDGIEENNYDYLYNVDWKYEAGDTNKKEVVLSA